MSFLVLVVIVGTVAAVGGSLAYTLRFFKASNTPATDPENGGHAAEPVHAIAPHDRATTKLLKQFFDGKECAICARPIPAVHWMAPKPGLFDPAAKQTHSWDEIPNENLAATLESQLPLCSTCQIAESFRQAHADLVTDRERAREHA